MTNEEKQEEAQLAAQKQEAQLLTSQEAQQEADEATEEALSTGPKKIQSKTLRAWSIAAVFAFVAMGLLVHSGTGTPSSVGWDYISAICPLGALEAIFGTWAFVPRLLIALAAVVVIVLFVGKAFCAWGCPVPHIQNVFKTKKVREEEADERHEAADHALEHWKNGDKPTKKAVDLDSRHAVLGGTLLTTAIFGFPVFCAICPIGLTFGTFILFWRLVSYNELTWGLLAFPIIIVLEVVLLKKWCGRICPIGALLSLLSKGNKTFRPTVDHSVCLRDTNGTACKACDAACPEKIDPYANLGDRPMDECVRCRSCVDACPVSAIKLPFLAKKSSK